MGNGPHVGEMDLFKEAMATAQLFWSPVSFLVLSGSCCHEFAITWGIMVKMSSVPGKRFNLNLLHLQINSFSCYNDRCNKLSFTSEKELLSFVVHLTELRIWVQKKKAQTRGTIWYLFLVFWGQKTAGACSRILVVEGLLCPS